MACIVSEQNETIEAPMNTMTMASASQRVNVALRLLFHAPDRRCASYATDTMQISARMAALMSASKSTIGFAMESRYSAIIAA